MECGAFQRAVRTPKSGKVSKTLATESMSPLSSAAKTAVLDQKRQGLSRIVVRRLQKSEGNLRQAAPLQKGEALRSSVFTMSIHVKEIQRMDARSAWSMLTRIRVTGPKTLRHRAVSLVCFIQDTIDQHSHGKSVSRCCGCS